MVLNPKPLSHQPKFNAIEVFPPHLQHFTPNPIPEYPELQF